MPIRIMHIIETLETGGLERGVVNLVNKMDPERFEHVVCTIRRLGSFLDQLSPDRVRVVCLNRDHPGLSVNLVSLLRTIAKVNPHVVHSRNWGAVEAIPAGWCLRSCGLIHSEHGIDVGTGHLKFRRKWLRRFAYSLADRVLSVSYQLREFLARETGFPADKIDVMHNGVDTERFRIQPLAGARERQRLGIPLDTFCVGAVGRLEPEKDLMTLFRAAMQFPAEWKNWRILIAGDGSESKVLREFVNCRPELRNSIVFLGEVQNVPEILKALDIYVLPSITEGISNSLLEAMASGLPVVASATGGNPEVVVDNESGLLFPVGDSGSLASKLLLLREQGDRRTRLGRQALQRIQEHFSMDAMVSRYERLYYSVALLPRIART